MLHKSSSTHQPRVVAKAESRRWLFRSASCHGPTSSNTEDLNASCESLDLACGVFDTKGNMIPQSLTGTPGHINPMATGAIHFLETYPPETLRPGDVLVTNDPWQTAGQVNDFTVMTPVFRDSKARLEFPLPIGPLS